MGVFNNLFSPVKFELSSKGEIFLNQKAWIIAQAFFIACDFSSGRILGRFWKNRADILKFCHDYPFNFAF